uniref:Saposin B-type domain-containing protein n=1 Tax=Brassica oleracea var. oleracea TaxID=109376 RepID=A0A0D3B4V8_BRAOL
MTCSQIPPLQKQCLAMVDRYTQRFFTQVSLLKPHHICKSLNLCQPPLHSQGNCDACHDTVSQLLPKLKDPQTKLKIIRLLLKECKSLNNYQDKCKKMVFEYGPLMLADLENFLEKKDAHNDDGTRCLFRLRVKVQRASLSHSLTHSRDMGDEAEERFRKHHLRIDSESKPECGRKSPDSEDSYGVLWRRRVEEKVESKKKMDPWFVSRGCGSNAHHRHSLFSTDKITFSFCQSCSQ